MVNLLENTALGGCSAKISPTDLHALLLDLPMYRHPQLMIGADSHDDAAVFKLNEEAAIIKTLDFFPPICADPYEFGQIAATNSLSDIYAMGGTPIMALNIVTFPAQEMDLSVLKEILRGGADKMKEALTSLSGGHTIDDPTVKYGLSVTGLAHPREITSNASAKVGDLLILTKPLGTGVIVAAQKRQICPPTIYQRTLNQMKQLNRTAAEAMRRFGVTCATDVTGFGLLGHLKNIVKESQVEVDLWCTQLPLIEGVLDLVAQGCQPCAAGKNEKFISDVLGTVAIDSNLQFLTVDAQTSGGLLIAVKESAAQSLLSQLHQEGLESAQIIGQVQTHGTARIHLKR